MSSSKTQFPIIKWAQRKDRLFITIEVVHTEKPFIDLIKGRKLKYQGTDGSINYAFELEFYDEIIKKESKYTLEPKNIFLDIKKKKSGPYWPRLTKDETKFHWIKVDWAYFCEEDEEEETAQPNKKGQYFEETADEVEMDIDDETNCNNNEKKKEEEKKEGGKNEYNNLNEGLKNTKNINRDAPFEKYITYTKDSNGNIKSPMLDNMKIGNIMNFNKYSIFESNSEIFKDDIKYINDLLTNYIKTKKIENKLSLLESGSIGSMLGMVIADSMGHRYEFEDVRYNIITLEDMGDGPGGAFDLLPGQWTDDTSMGLCLADSLIMKNGEYDAHDLIHRFISWWFFGYDNAFRFDDSRSHSVGLGGQISASLYNYISTPKEETIMGDINSSGIGSIMRNAAVPICYHNNINKAMDIAKRQSLSTHQGNEAAECCRLLTYIIVKILNRKDEKLNDIIDNLEKFETPVNSVKCLALSKEESEDPDRDWNWKKKDFKYSPTRSKNQPGYIGSYAMDGMAMALHVIYYTTNFKDAIIKVVNLRGDSDSVGAVVGQIAGAYYGVENIPSEWIETVSQWDHFEIPLRGYILQKLFK